jgi:hypothetical protein
MEKQRDASQVSVLCERIKKHYPEEKKLAEEQRKQKRRLKQAA